MLLYIEKGCLKKVIKADEDEGKRLLSQFLNSFPILKIVGENFSPVIMHFKNDEGFSKTEDGSLVIRKGATYVIQFSLPIRDDENYYKDCLLLAREFLKTYHLIEETSDIFETLMEYGEEDVTVQ